LRALQHPHMAYADAGLRARLSSPSLVLPHALLLGPAMDTLLHPLRPSQVSFWGLVIMACLGVIHNWHVAGGDACG
jgi:hypothetical protein